MDENTRKLLIAYNKLRDSKCLLEVKLEATWLRPQRRHYPQFNRESEEGYKEKKIEPDSGRTSWIRITPPAHKEKRHFPHKRTDHAIFG